MNTADSGAGSLRQAVIAANAAPGADTIEFDQTTFGTSQTIGFTGGEMSITDAVSIYGPGANLLTLIGGPVATTNNRFFNVGTSGIVSISGMTLSQGNVVGGGGAIIGSTAPSNIQLNNMVLTNNTSSGDGGAVAVVSSDGKGNLDITGCTLANNTGGCRGGAISCQGALTITNSTLVGNTGGIGGAIYASPLAARNCTITGNTARATPNPYGGGVLGFLSSYSSCIVAGNKGTDDIHMYVQPPFIPHPGGNNNVIGLSSPSFEGTGNIINVYDPQVGTLNNNGGPTPTCALKLGSPAIDKGNNSAGLSYDQRGPGFPRAWSAAADCGAFEIGPVPYMNPQLTDVTTGGGTSGTVALSYIDDAAINVSTIDVNDVTITGPNGFTATPTFVTVDVPSNGTPRLATYTFTPPGGSWDPGDNGFYTVTLKANQVFDADTVPNAIPGGATATFRVGVPPTFVVNAVNDEAIDTNGKMSFREAVQRANATLASTSTITFDPTVFSTPQLINLAGQVTISRSVSIIGPGAAMLTLKNVAAASPTSRVLEINSPGSLQTVTISRLTVTGGNVTGGATGGGISLDDDSLTLLNTVISGNKTDGAGGGLGQVGAGSLTVTDCTISSNSAGGQGGGLTTGTLANLYMQRCTIESNAAVGFGGGLFISTKQYFSPFDPPNSFFRNCTVSGNTSDSFGGGIYLAPPPSWLIIDNSTITANHAASRGGGILFQSNSSGTPLGAVLVFRSTIVAGNDSLNGPDIATSLNYVSPSLLHVFGDNSLLGAADTSAYTIEQSVGPLQYGTLAAPLDPLLGPLAYNGGPTRTHTLLSGSPAIDKGDSGGLATDQRGFARVYNGKSDVGSFELQPISPPIVQSALVNNGSAQRSIVTKLTVTFSEAVTFPNGVAAAFQLNRTGPGGPAGAVNLNLIQAGNSVTVTFAAGGAVGIDPGGSLIDGRYTLTLVASKIQGPGGFLDGNGDGTAGDDFVSPTTPGDPNRIFRLFGDSDGNGVVDGNDFNAFRIAFNSNSAIFDFDGNGIVDGTDFGQFRSRFGVAI